MQVWKRLHSTQTRKPEVFSSSASQESSPNSDRIELRLPTCKLQFLSLPFLSCNFTSTSLFSIKCFIRQPQKMLHKKQPTCILQLLQFVSLFFVLRCCFQHSAELQFACLSRESLGFTWLWTFVWLTLGTQENVSWQRIKQNKSFCGKLIVNLILLFPL